jgi:hypothetical protein
MSEDRDYSRQIALRKYGLTPREYNALLRAQSGVCAICGQPPAANKILCVDHDHKTDEVRGLLCNNCNTGLGMFKDRIRLLAAAIVYLEDNGKKY